MSAMDITDGASSMMNGHLPNTTCLYMRMIFKCDGINEFDFS